MPIDRGRITGMQFLFSVTCMIQSSFLLTSLIATQSKHDSWIVVLIGMLFTTPMLLTFLGLMKMFPQKNIIQINDIVFGTVGGKIASACYIFFFFTLLSLNLRDMGNFVQGGIMPKTPVYVTMIVFMLVCAWAARNGCDVVTRYSVPFTIIAFLILMTAIMLNIGMMRFENFLPAFRQPFKTYIQGSNIIATIPFGEVVIFLMITPNVKLSAPRVRKCLVVGYILGFLHLLLVVLRDIAILGSTLPLFTLPPFEAYRMTAISPALSRMEILFAISSIILLFFKISFLHYVTIAAIAQATGIRQFKHLALGIGAIAVVYATIIFASTAEHMQAGRNQIPFLWLFFELLLPLGTLICAKIKGLGQTDEQEAVAE